MGIIDLCYSLFFVYITSFPRIVFSSKAGIPGINYPLNIDPIVKIDSNKWLLDLYQELLARPQDAVGYSSQLQLMQFEKKTKKDIYGNFIYSSEFQSNPSLQDKSGFVTRLYNYLLHRTPSDLELKEHVLHLSDYDEIHPIYGTSWLQEIDNFYASPEYKASNCQFEYYSFLSVVPDVSTLLLHDLFDGKARLQYENESSLINLIMPSALRIWDQKLSILPNPKSSTSTSYIAFTRAFIQEPNTFSVVLLQTDDGINFSEVNLLWQPKEGDTFYDPHVSIDYSVCPPRYVMAMECAGTYGTASLCLTSTTDPNDSETWFYPEVAVDGIVSPAAQSASTGVAFTDGIDRYLSWTQVYDGVGTNDPTAHTFSQSEPVSSYYDSAYYGTVTDRVVTTMMSSEPHPYCTDAWDCNNRDKQDWKKEGDFFYAIYNGANYYRCNGTWGVSVSRSKVAVGKEYTDRLPFSLGILAGRSDTCGISYPILNVIGGVPYIYYAYVQQSGENQVRRSGIVPV